MTLAIDTAVEHEAWRSVPDLDSLIRRAVAAAIEAGDAEAPVDADLSVVLCDDAFIRGLNARWRGKDQATNVLSFPSTDTALLGDIVVAYETCRREAADEGRALEDHLAHLIVHGVFHLLGFDHEDEAQADEMERRESLALAALGIASPYEIAEPAP